MSQLKETSMAAVFQNQAQKYGDEAVIAYKKNGVYTDLSWNQMNDLVHKIGWYLLSVGVKKGDRVAIFAENRYEWWACDLATLSINAIDVPIYATDSADEAKYILNNSESKVCFAGTKSHLSKVLEVKKSLKKLKYIIILDELKQKKPGVISLKDALKKGEAYRKKDAFEKALKNVKPSDVATIIYTSGTTGNPKGVMLTHSNFISNVSQCMDGIKGYLGRNIFLSFLPLSHSLERTCGFYVPISVGAKVAFAESFQTIQTDLQTIRPEVIVSVPRLYEKIHSGILAKVADAPSVKKFLFNWAMGLAKKNLPYICRQKPRTGFFASQYNLADKLIFSKLKHALGMERLKLSISGGAPLSSSDAEFFLGMGMVILEGFGLTETTPVTNFNRPSLIKPGTVGLPVKDTTIKIDNNGELLIKGPQVMKGYYKDPRATKEVFTRSGFFKTGDIAVVDDDNYLIITGRIKDIIVTAGGKNISPQNIENSLKTSEFIEQAGVIGDRRKYLTALIIPSFEELSKWARKMNIQFSSNKDLIKNEQVISLIDEEIKKYTRQFARVEQIRNFKLLDAEWTQATGELTPTLKVKRNIISKKYAKEIEGMYALNDQE